MGWLVNKRRSTSAVELPLFSIHVQARYESIRAFIDNNIYCQRSPIPSRFLWLGSKGSHLDRRHGVAKLLSSDSVGCPVQWENVTAHDDGRGGRTWVAGVTSPASTAILLVNVYLYILGIRTGLSAPMADRPHAGFSGTSKLTTRYETYAVPVQEQLSVGIVIMPYTRLKSYPYENQNCEYV